ncbi:hypothetical protein [Luteimonas terricola]|nr:hypothetical protein [Luteimonas terricola]
MSPVRLRDDVTPWSFFLPMMLAVAVGILVADVVGHVVGAVFGSGSEPVAATAVVERAGTDYDEFEDEAPLEDAAVVEVGQSSGGDLVMLPGPVAAMRDGAERACINHTIALRRPNGWEQGLEDNVPLRCRASSP